MDFRRNGDISQGKKFIFFDNNFCMSQKISIFVINFLIFMIVISSAELRNNMRKYLDFANTETVVIQRRKTETFVLSAQVGIPNEDLVRAITKDELLTGIKSDIQAMYASGQQ
jgi:hypothetical protein